jgi:hypothetical protein
MTKLEWNDGAPEIVWRSEAESSGSFAAEIREYESGRYMLNIELDVFSLSDGKRLAEKIFDLVNEPVLTSPAVRSLASMYKHHAACSVWDGHPCTCSTRGAST